MKKILYLIATILLLASCEKDDPKPQQTQTGQTAGKDTVCIFGLFGTGTNKQITCSFALENSGGNVIKIWDTTVTYNGGYTSTNPQRIILKLNGIPTTGNYYMHSKILLPNASGLEVGPSLKTIEFTDSDIQLVTGYMILKNFSGGGSTQVN